MADEKNIRRAKVEDADKIIDVYKYYVLNTPISFECDVPTVEAFENRIETIMKFYPYLVYEENGKILGYAYASRFRERKAYDWNVELSVYVDINSGNKGIGTLLYNKILAVLKEMNIVNAYAVILHPNVESESFHERMGFKRVALFEKTGYKLGQWRDLVYMLKVINDYIELPVPVKSADETKIYKCF